MFLKIKFLIIFACILGISVFAFAQESFNKSGISMQGPEGWFLSENNPSGAIVFSENRFQPQKGATISIFGRKITAAGTYTAQDVAIDNIEGNRKSGELVDFKNEPFQSIKINGVEGVKVVVSYKSKVYDAVTASTMELKTKGINYYFVKGDKIVMIIAAGDFDLLNKYEPIFEKAVSTLKIE